MKGVDTNILARFFIDDPDDIEAQNQQETAIQILSECVFIPITVILEFEWVMRGFYKLDKETIFNVYQTLLSFHHLTVEDHVLVIQALDLYQQGLDFADAIHLVRSQENHPFVTFDIKFYKKAKKANLKIELAK